MIADTENNLRLIQEPTEVPCSSGINETVYPGDIWPAPYRGSKYTIRLMKGTDGSFRNRLCWTRMEAIYHRRLFAGLMPGLKEIKGEDFRGSIRITSWREVLCKKFDLESNSWIAYYVGKLHGTLEFDGFFLDPDIKCGQFWRGFHFKHGETWSVWVRSGSGDYLYWSRRGHYFKSIKEHPQLVGRIREMRPRGGRCYITEHGHIWMNLPNGEAGNMWNTEINKRIKADSREFMTSDDWNELMESIAERYSITKTRPIYVGRITDFDDGESPRTYFENNAFSNGTKDEDEDDEDGFASRGYRQMRRD